MQTAWIPVICAMVAAFAAIISTIRNLGHDSSKHIDERIQLGVGVELTEIKAGIRELRLMIPSRDVQTQDGQRINDLQRQQEEMKKHINECFERLRAVETSCARNGHGGTSNG